MTERIRDWILQNPVVLVFLAAQSIALIVWGVRIESRVSVLEQYGSPVEIALQRNIAVIEARQQAVIVTLQENSRKIDTLSEMIQRHLSNDTRK